LGVDLTGRAHVVRDGATAGGAIERNPLDDGDRAGRAEVTLDRPDDAPVAHPWPGILLLLGRPVGDHRCLVIHTLTIHANATSSCPVRASSAGRRPLRRTGAICASCDTSRSAPGARRGITIRPSSRPRRAESTRPCFGSDRSHRPVWRARRPPCTVTPHTGWGVAARAYSSTGAPTPVASTATTRPPSAMCAM